MAVAVIARRRGWMTLVSSSNQVREISEIALSSSNQVRESSEIALTSSNQDREISEIGRSNGNVWRPVPVDTLLLVRSMERQGVPTKHAEAMTWAIIEVLNGALENVSQSCVSNGRMQKSEILQDSKFSKFKSEVQSSLEHSISVLQREIEKLKVDNEKLRTELRYEVDKATAGQRLDLNLEKGRMRDELSKQSAETANVNSKLDREIHAVKALLEGAKYDIIKYCVGSVLSITALGVAIHRIMM